jgi:hypothetical protein
MKTKLEMIAIFMGEKKMVGCYYMPNNREWSPIKYSYESEIKEHYEPKEMKYHTSWDWLIPVVSKILTGSYTLEGVKKMKEVQNSLITCSIEKTFESVCNFIGWSNSF